MTRKPRFTSSRIVLLSLTASLFSLSAQADVSNQPLSASSTFATSLGNVGQAVDNIAPLGLQYPTRDAGMLLDSVVDAADMEYLRARILDAISLGDTVGNLHDLVRNNPDNPYPISNTLTDLTGSLANTTGALFQDGPHAPAHSGPLNGLASNNPDNANLLSPITNLINAADGGLLNTNTGKDSLLNPVSNLLGGLTAGLPNPAEGNHGLLTPITGLVTSLQGNASTGPVNNVQASLPASSSATTTANHGLLAPVTGLVSGLLGGAPH